ncbi:DUF58 domain-containing protein [Acidimicrobium ferrooxidans]|uniref:DUF58 domain-containing protein n=1 Tax=Acidimicrobium ferrooxidans TaxID=53635 RepID=A0ABS3APG9_9ACTN|nr:DUF58 domain-containing protein [Acidimicrobium ferrooxidans]
MRLTRQGVLLTVVGAALVLAGRIFSIWELYVLGAALVALVAVAALSVASSRLRLGVARKIQPSRLHAGEPARVDLAVTNRGGRTPLLHLLDPVQGTSGAHVILGPLYGGEKAGAAYQLPKTRRGILTVGPLDIQVTDSFGLAKLNVSAASANRLTVFPKLHDIVPVPFTTGDEIAGAAPSPDALGRTGDDFYALRQYTVGDDLRRVHWRSTARHGELMVRQQELPWNGRLTVMLDNRRRTQDDQPFELAVEVAASLLAASSRRRDLTRLITTAGGDSGGAAGGLHLDSMLEFLAIVKTTPAGTLKAALSSLLQGSGGGALVIVLATPTQSEIDESIRLRLRYPSVTVVACNTAPRDDVVSQPVPGVTVINANDATAFVDGWAAARGRRKSTAWV